MAGVGAFALQANSNDAAVAVTLPPGNYTANVSSASGDSGVVLLEADQVGSSGSAQLANLSSRAFVSGEANGKRRDGLRHRGLSGPTILVRAMARPSPSSASLTPSWRPRSSS